MSTNTIVVGCQWGDEGKGKVVDLLAEKADAIARFQGGANAGHTVLVGDKKYILHLIPSGIIYPDKLCYIGNGVVLDPFGLLEEIELLRTQGIDTNGRLFISSAANLVLPYHKLIDSIEEKKRGGDGIGTTLRGIGPAYRDKVSRNGIRLCDIFAPDSLKQKLEHNRKIKQEYFAGCDDDRADTAKIFDDLQRLAPLFEPMMTNVSLDLQRLHREGKCILFEGAQGALLDIDLGSYPYTTSSNTTVGGAMTGLGISPKMIDEIVGIVKAYTTRVGSGPFPTELVDQTGNELREIGGEYGAATGRPRRTGWLDLVVLRHACRINGVEKIAVTKLDVLDRFSTIKVCTAYKLGDREMAELPLNPAALWDVKPVYRDFPGWNSTTAGIDKFEGLPENARKYLSFIADDLGVEICLISTGARRNETILV
ncbi:MAG: adenylosuccinate synthase [candidate division Zixibacteria bacterium]|nr:adenylosuccinate synthase [candidate division Zixibacteria bacterium]